MATVLIDATNEGRSVKTMREAMQFSMEMEDTFQGSLADAVDAKFAPARQLMANLKHLLNWGGDSDRVYTLYMGGGEFDVEARRGYLDWAIASEGRRTYNGGLLYRDDEWSMHS